MGSFDEIFIRTLLYIHMCICLWGLFLTQLVLDFPFNNLLSSLYRILFFVFQFIFPIYSFQHSALLTRYNIPTDYNMRNRYTLQRKRNFLLIKLSSFNVIWRNSANKICTYKNNDYHWIIYDQKCSNQVSTIMLFFFILSGIIFR